MAYYYEQEIDGQIVWVENNIISNEEIKSYTANNLKRLGDGKTHLTKYFQELDTQDKNEVGEIIPLYSLQPTSSINTLIDCGDVSDELYSASSAKLKRKVIFKAISNDLAKGVKYNGIR